ncbi:peptidase M23B [Novosphingobium nitrogenifigens DSM 19370]|uniref:Peptidase M23B n=1 Tax=Novosphingobium nitrogenifigens DSM 19370 TaxID=983920 RepID=F1Z5Y1_9SPHN|nr:peptidoglycan DD-metalloendopeptidase family protein [Novosphingobium nitrogenifigens]EGD60241.1 peptidase M23B [Novosphingobium nitrogenifigens DSM 19370]
MPALSLRSKAALMALAALPPALGALALAALADDAPYASSGEAGQALGSAERSLADARARAERLDRDAASASQALDRTAREAAAVAARIQQAEAEIGLAHARIAVIDRQRTILRQRIARREQPLVRLTAALQMMARRPLVFSLLRADSLRETVWLRATLETMLPEVARRTAALRAELIRGRQLQQEARTLAAGLGQSRQTLAARQRDLVMIESRQRVASRAASGNASREADRVLALSEEARDLGALVTRLHQDDELAMRLAALPGPVARPAGGAGVTGNFVLLDRPAPAVVAHFSGILPVTGRLVSGYGEMTPTGPRQAIVFAPAGGAQAVAPADGRIAFAGPYRGYGRIVIIEHDGGWSSLVTGLGRLDAAVGDRVVQGAPIGAAEPGRPQVTIELRKDGVPVNPMEFLHP